MSERECPTCEGRTPTGLRRKGMAGFHCPTCGHKTPDTPPAGAVCVENGCTLPAVTTRPITEPWLTDTGVVIDADEWVCSIHATKGDA